MFGPIRLWNNEYAKSHPVVENKDAKIAQEQALDVKALMEDQRHYELTYKGDIQNGAVLLGQSIGIIKEVSSVKDIINDVVKGAEAAIKRISALIS